ncbi:MAG: hypothetical protein OSA99_14965 [Acidimicrobiales bacterium]|nr:hypothetical protein [Acidimicrobiales bacterium]
MAEHRTELRRQLVEAAARDNQRPGGRGRPPVLAVAVATTIAVAALAIMAVQQSRPAGAEVFEVRTDNQSLVINVVGKVEDPRDAATELRGHGLEVDVVGVPAAPWLVGEIVAVASDDGEPAVEASGGLVRSVTVDASDPPKLTINYGREARGDEGYEATSSDPECADRAGSTLTDDAIASLRRTYGPRLRWQVADSQGIREAQEAELLPLSTVVDIVPTSPVESIVIVTNGVNAAPPGMTCAS